MPGSLARFARRIPWPLLVIGSLTLGLAPFTPQPHLVEKLGMLATGELNRAIDWFDLLLHGVFPALLLWRLADAAWRRRARRH